MHAHGWLRSGGDHGQVQLAVGGPVPGQGGKRVYFAVHGQVQANMAGTLKPELLVELPGQAQCGTALLCTREGASLTADLLAQGLARICLAHGMKCVPRSCRCGYRP